MTSPVPLNAIVADFDQIGQQPNAADRGRRQDRGATAGRLAFIVERHVARHDREVERAARIAHAVEAAGQLRHDLGPLRIGEVEAVGDRQRQRADRREVAIAFGDRLLAALIRIGVAIAWGAIGAHRQPLLRAVDAHDGCVAAGALDRIGTDLRVVLLPDPAARGDIGRGHQLEEIGGDIGRFRNFSKRRHLGPGLILFLARSGPVVKRRFVGERGERDVGDGVALPLQHHAPGVGDMADDREIELPFAEDRLGKILAAGASAPSASAPGSRSASSHTASCRFRAAARRP